MHARNKIKLSPRIAVLLSLLLSCSPLLAEQQQQLVLDLIIDCQFEPSEVAFIVQIDQQTSIYPVSLIELNNSGTPNLPNRYLALQVLPLLNKPNHMQALLFARSESGEGCFRPINTSDPKELNKRFNYMNTTRNAISQLRSQIINTDLQISISEKELQAIKQDARIIGRLGRIALKEAELKRLEDQIVMLNQDIERLNGFLHQASIQTSPVNFTRKQAELTTQLEELAKAGRLVEDSEQNRTQTSQSDWEQALALIEETRYDDPVDLKSQLEQLREARMRTQARMQQPATDQQDSNHIGEQDTTEVYLP